MGRPSDLRLPFFTYGLFRPGQIGHGDIRPFVDRCEDAWYVEGTLLERDGLPVLTKGDKSVQGALLHFFSEDAERAYDIIAAIEPGKLYRWETADVANGNLHCTANVVFGKKPARGSHPLDSD